MNIKALAFAILLPFSTLSMAKSPVDHCVEGAGQAIKSDALWTAGICAVDVLFTFGASGVCIAKIGHSIANAPTQVAIGCASAALLGGEGAPVYEAVNGIQNVSEGLNAAKTVVDIIQ